MRTRKWSGTDRVWQQNSESAPFALVRLGSHATPVGLGDPSDDRESQPRAAALAVRLAIGVEDVGESIGGDADAGVLDLKLELRARVDDAGDDAPAARREPDRVGSQVDDQLVKPLFVTPVHEVDAETLALEGHPRLRGARVELLEGAVHELRQVERLSLNLHEPGLQPRHLEDLVHEPQQASRALPDDVGE